MEHAVGRRGRIAEAEQGGGRQRIRRIEVRDGRDRDAIESIGHAIQYGIIFEGVDPVVVGRGAGGEGHGCGQVREVAQQISRAVA